ncbi:MAG: hypothetical protein ACKOW4_07575 [Aquirufa sp.]
MEIEKNLGLLEATNNPKSLIVKGIQRYEYIPIDFIKCQIIKLNPEFFLNNTNLDFRSLVNRDTGEFKPKRVAFYKNIKITIADSGFIEFSGSIHKYLNDGIHNYNDFTYSDYKVALNRIYEDFKILLDIPLQSTPRFRSKVPHSFRFKLPHDSAVKDTSYSGAKYPTL